MNVLETPIYKAIAPRVRKQDRKELARMLGLAIKAANEAKEKGVMYGYTGSDDLVSAFPWSLTPQGVEYWAELDDRLDA